MKGTASKKRKRDAAAVSKPKKRKRDAAAVSNPKKSALPVSVLPGPKYWKRLAPGLHVGDSEFLASVQPIQLPADAVARLREQILKDGFFTLPPEALPWASSLREMRIGVRRLLKRGWPATMLLVYDEAWAMVHQLAATMAAVSGGCANSLDTLAWSITPSLGQSGFAPHRDRQPADVSGSFRRDGTPKYCTAWIALSEATTDNSCLYLVPRGHDPGYDAGDDHSADAEDPLLRVFRSSDAAVQSVRACPLSAGGAVIFTHRAMHWGSKGQDGCADARISISFGHTDPSFEKPYFAVPERALPFPRIPLRIALAAAQLICYHERFEFDVALLRRLGATFRAHKKAFTKEYAEKVAAEFKSALDDRQTHAANDGSGDDDDSDADAALDDALDAMLDAQASADGNLFDDYDDYEEESDD